MTSPRSNSTLELLIFLSRAKEWREATILLEAADLLNQAVARDPSFFKAYCLLASTHDQLYFYGYDHTPARLASAEAAIEERHFASIQTRVKHTSHAPETFMKVTSIMTPLLPNWKLPPRPCPIMPVFSS